MRKIIVMITLIISFCSFSQEKIQTENTLELRFDIRFDQFRVEWQKELFNIKIPFSTLCIVSEDGIELFEGIVIPLADNISFIPSAGVEYLYKEQEFKPRFRGTLKINLDRVYVLIRYVSDTYVHGVKTRFAYGVIGDRLQLGVESIDENIGPLLRFKINVGKEKRKMIQASSSYVNKQFRFSLKFNINE